VVTSRDSLGDVGDAAETKARLASGARAAYLVPPVVAGADVGLGVVPVLALGTPLVAGGAADDP